MNNAAFSPWVAVGPSIFAEDSAFSGVNAKKSETMSASLKKSHIVLPGSNQKPLKITYLKSDNIALHK